LGRKLGFACGAELSQIETKLLDDRPPCAEFVLVKKGQMMRDGIEKSAEGSEEELKSVLALTLVQAEAGAG
jgi:hypothetical protein